MKNRISGFLMVLFIWLFLPMNSLHAQTTAPWAYPDRGYRIKLSVSVNNTERYDFPTFIQPSFTGFFNNLNEPGTFDENSLRLTEIDTQGQAIDMNVPFQFDKGADYNNTNRAYGDFIWLAKGTTVSGTSRRYYLYFDKIGHNFAAAQFQPLIKLTDAVQYQGLSSYKIESRIATYYYDKQGGAFSGMIDTQGNDWIGYNATTRISSGIPNIMYPENYFHPGTSGVTSTIINSGPLRVTIVSTTLDNSWQTRWDMYPEYAFMTVVKHSHPYWFAYEGTAGGTTSAALDYIVDSQNNTSTTTWEKPLTSPEWVYIGDPGVNRVLYFGHVYPQDGVIDSYQPQNMITKFAFGRSNNTPLIDRPQMYADYFIMGFAESKLSSQVIKIIRSSYDVSSAGSDWPEKNIVVCPQKSFGDADCKKDPITGKDVSLTDFEIWRKEFFAKCNELELAKCGVDSDGIGTTMDADFNNLPEVIYNNVKGVAVSDYEIWRKGYYNTAL